MSLTGHNMRRRVCERKIVAPVVEEVVDPAVEEVVDPVVEDEVVTETEEKKRGRKPKVQE